MSRHPEPLPNSLGDAAFTTAEAASVGIRRSRLRARDLATPFHAVRNREDPDTPLLLATSYLPKLVEGRFFSHMTAALVHGMWLPLELERAMVLHVSVRKPLRAPRGRRVQGHHLIDRPTLVWRVGPLRVANPWETWAQLAWYLSEEQLVVAGEALLAKGRPNTRVMFERLVSVASDPDRHFHEKLAAAAARLRMGSRSAAESRFRLFLVRNGLPEPEVNVRLHDLHGAFVAEGDLVYRRERIVIEYEGDHHRERKQFRHDITRVEKIQDIDHHVIRVTEDDVQDDPAGTISRIRRAIEKRRPR